MAFIWSPLAATATRNLPPQLAGAGSGVYNATRQVGSVLGSASMAAFMTSRISAEMPTPTQGPRGEGSVTSLPEFLHEPFAAAMSQSTLLPAFFALFGVIAALFLLGFGNQSATRADAARDDDTYDDRTDAIGYRFYSHDYAGDDVYYDDDEYLEYTVSWDEPEPRALEPSVYVDEADGDTEPMAARAERVLHAPAEPWRSGPVESWQSLLGEASKPAPEPIGFAHNGFHVDRRFSALHRREPEASGRHSHAESDDAAGYGRHSMPGHD